MTATMGPPAGLVADMARPRLYDQRSLAVPCAGALGRRPRPALPLPLPGKGGRAHRAGPT
ncbi:hypothetical protein HCJ93_24650 [Streptomyces sp. SBST2-5]|uniref:Uncharacterized protein n=1 Tax=Streptomyces composti TaxID=2720025 RepID=A0ABX1AHP1_9ACTN|nr:hypothetical protein [Streptomyces composti]NJP53168.1 hypothetical protein [Streptomyces composti]